MRFRSADDRLWAKAIFWGKERIELDLRFITGFPLEIPLCLNIIIVYYIILV